MPECADCSAKTQLHLVAERWVPLPGFEEYVEISDRGRLRSLDRITHIPATRRTAPYTRIHKGKMLKQSRHPAGYMYISINGGGKQLRNAKVHQLVLQAFVGPRPNGMQCCHANDIPDDNRLENLRWDTRQANLSDQRANGGFKRNTHCPQGHEYTEDNTYFIKNPRPARRCRTCVRAQRRAG